MPRPKKNAQPADDDAAFIRVLILYYRNRQAQAEWYRSAPSRGVELGHIQVGEMAASDDAQALDLALQGKSWQPPEI